MSADAVHEFLGALPGFGGALLDFLSVLIQTAQKPDTLPSTTGKSGQGIRQDFFIRVPKVGFSVCVINCGGEEQAIHEPSSYQTGAKDSI
jgi:hypothetical protein